MRVNPVPLRTSGALDERTAQRLRAGLLRQLTTAPPSEWTSALEQCLASLAASGVSGIDDTNDRSSTKASPHVQRICLYIRRHYGEPISLRSLAARVGRNTEYIATLFRRQTGTTIHRFLTQVRMQRAATLLQRAEKVEAVMLQVGYRGKKNFYRQFATEFGVTPGQYKARAAR